MDFEKPKVIDFSLENLNNIISNIQKKNEYSFHIDILENIVIMDKNKRLIFKYLIDLQSINYHVQKFKNPFKTSLGNSKIIKYILYIFHLIDNEIQLKKDLLFPILYQYLFFLKKNNIIDIQELTFITQILFQINLENIYLNYIINENSFQIIEKILDILIKNNFQIPFILGEKLISSLEILIENDIIKYQIKKNYFFFKLLKLNIKEKNLMDKIYNFLLKMEFLINDEFYQRIYFRESVEDLEYFNKISKYIKIIMKKEKEFFNSKQFKIKSGFLLIKEIIKKTITLPNDKLDQFSIMFSFKIFENKNNPSKNEINILQYLDEKNNEFRLFYKYLNDNCLTIEFEINKKKVFTKNISFSFDYFICVSGYHHKIKIKNKNKTGFLINFNGEINYFETGKISHSKKGTLKISDVNSFGIFGDFFFFQKRFEEEDMKLLNDFNNYYHYFFQKKKFPQNEITRHPKFKNFENNESIKYFFLKKKNYSNCNISQISLNNYNDSNIINYKIEFPIYSFINNKGIEFLILQLHNLSSQNDNNIFNKGMITIFKLLNPLFEKDIFNDYFDKSEDEYNEINLFFVSLISIFYNTKEEDLKIKISNKLFQIMNSFIISFNLYEQYFLRDLLFNIILDLKFYEKKTENISSFFQLVKNSFQNGNINKEIYKRVIKIGFILNKKHEINQYFKLILDFLLEYNQEINEIIIHQILSDLFNLKDENHKMKFKFLKFVYINLNFFENKIQSLFNKLKNELETIQNSHCKYCQKSLYLCYLLINLINNENSKFKKGISKYYFNYSFMINPTINFLYCVLIEPFDKFEPKIKWKIIKKKNFDGILEFSSYNSFSNKNKFCNKMKSIYFYFNYVINRQLYNSKNQNEIKQNVIYILNWLFNFICEINAIIEVSNYFFCKKGGICISWFNLFYSFINKKVFNKYSSDLFRNLIESNYNPFIFRIIFPINIKNIIIKYSLRDYFFDYFLSLLKKGLFDEYRLNNYIIFLSYIYQYLLNQKILTKKLESNILEYLSFFNTNKLFQFKFLIPINPLEQNNNISILEIFMKIIILLYEKFNKVYYSLFECFFLKDENNSIIYGIDNCELEEDNTFKIMKENLKRTFIQIDIPYCIIFLNELIDLKIKFLNNDKDMLKTIKKIIKVCLNENENLFKDLKIPEKKESHLKFGKDILELIQKNKNLSYESIKILCIEKSKLIFNKFENEINFQDNNIHKANTCNYEKNKEKTITSLINDEIERYKNPKNKNNKRKISHFFSYHKFKIDNNDIKITRKKSFNSKSNLLHKLYYSETKFEKEKINIPDYYFSNIFKKNNKIERKFCFNPKNILIWKNFSYAFSDLIFYNKKFIAMKKYFYSIYKKLMVTHKKEENSLELNYPTKLKNYTVKSYYKPFLKPDLNFYKNPLISISHKYYNNNKKDSRLSNIIFKKIIPTNSDRNNKIECEYFFNQGSIYGEFLFFDYFICFEDKSKYDKRNNKNLSFEKQYNYIFSSENEDKIIGRNKYILIFYDEIEEILIRSFFFQNIGFEIFLNNKKTYLFNFINKKNINKFKDLFTFFYNKLKLEKNDDLFKINLSKIFKKQHYQNEYKKGKLSSFNYLLMINKYTSRSYNNLNQYPIFPLLYLSSDNIKRRQLNKVLCIQNLTEQSKLKYLMNYEANECHFNIHYSNQGYILYYLIRVNPMSFLQIKFQSGKFDSPSRLFYSINDFLSVYEISEENRELIPEFFHNYNFMLNLNKNYFGKFNHELINNVNCFPFENCVHFIIDLRKKLDEIDIHDWIDFIFGYLQSKFDDEHFRLFPKFSYSKFNDLNKQLENIEPKKDISLLNEFRDKLYLLSLGITPIQIFESPHPIRDNIKKNKKEEIDKKIIKNFTSLIKNFRNKKYFFICEEKSIFLFSNDIIYELSTSLEIITNISDKEGKRINIIPENNCFCHYKKDLYFFCRDIDSVIKIYTQKKEFLVFEWKCFVSSIILQLLDEVNIIIGDQNGFISIFEVLGEKNDMSLKLKLSYKKHKSLINILVGIQRLDIIISADINGSIVISNWINLETLCQINLDKNIDIISINVTKYDLIYICYRRNRVTFIQCYTLNGLNVCHKVINSKINYVYYIEESDKLLLVANDKYYLYEIYKDLKEIKMNCTQFLYIYENNIGIFISKDSIIPVVIN